MMESVLPELRTPVDPQRYAGRWFELARTKDIPFEPLGMTDVCTEYTWDGAVMQVRNVALLGDRVVDWRAEARPTHETNTEFSLAVMAGPRRFDAKYRILDLDDNDYSWALVAGDEQNRWVWLLARERDQTDEWWSDKVHRLQQRFGVDFRRMVPTRHTREEPLCSPTPGVSSAPVPAEARVRRLANGDYVVETV